ncbi:MULTISPECIES: DUF3048 domain-containing protein [Paenibacillus]|jgi:hypothetical protein|uniref:DUF3048 domain-containing protein n=1 Tax=Paenibacillus TaxID=44249 RepID=UPI00096E5A26|nr:DUF3048 domain-containing protein [Paenibacillus sp. FSL H8-0259]OMF21994.1 hypothetical protein BK132_30995 [Paenibacillus sp. FSL H8-0259]
MTINRSSARPISVFVLAAALLSACGTENAVTVPVPTTVAATVEPQPTEAAQPTPTIAPAAGIVSGLTGLPATDGTLPRPLAVMINNAPAARPQSGVSEADILYEVLAEGGITRLIGIFQSHTGVVKIGPIRSIRPYLLDIGESYGGVTVHAGGSPAAYAILQKQKKEDMDEIGRAGAYFWRDKERKAPHNLYSNAAKLREGAGKLGFAESVEVPGLLFTDPDYAPTEGKPALEFNVSFLLKSYTVGYKYNAEQRTYVRWVNGKPHLDLNNNSPVAAANVIVMGSDHKVLDDVGRLQVDVELGGEALLFQRGVAIPGKWSRRPGDIIRFVKEDGREALMYPGITHILIVPNSPSFGSHVDYALAPSPT